MSSSQHSKRPTIALCMIVKNEEKNLPRLLASVKDCFDEIHVTDTGSTDKTLEVLNDLKKDHPIHIHNFTWINDFAAARNYSFSHAKTDYVMWMDADDVLSDKAGFIQWRDHAMEFADFIFNTYNYALDQAGKPVVSFVRERVFKRSINPAWKYKLHEGIVAQPGWATDYAVTWCINHLRDAHDIASDKSRNVTILEELRKTTPLDPRLQFYYGKELYEAGRTADAIAAFDVALTDKLEAHDRLLALQYGAYAAIQLGDEVRPELIDARNRYYDKAIDYCLKGIALEPGRAEFHVSAGDVFLKKGDLKKALPYYSAAKGCLNPKESGSPYEGAIYSFVDCYGAIPSIQIAKILLHLGKVDEAKKEAQSCLQKYGVKEAADIVAELERIEGLIRVENNQQQTEDIIFTCPAQSAYEFDEELYKTKPMGGSETALIQMAKYLKKHTGRRVIVFNMREKDLVAESGVEYISNRHLNEYLSKYRPKVNIAWRHNIELTKAPTYLWCHDLVTMGVEVKNNFDKILCLTPFHKNFVMAKQGVKADKVIVTRNGIPPEKFSFDKPAKNPNKIVWMSSPDRGLERAMHVCDIVKKKFPDIELHVYNSVENLKKYGLTQLADGLFKMMGERPYVKYHGFTEQSKMYKDVADAVIWCHPCNFIETYCITANEMLALNVYPVTRSLGGLADTLADAKAKGHATVLDIDCNSQENAEIYAREIEQALEQKKWEKIEFNIDKHSWESVALEWIEEMNLQPTPRKLEISA